MNNVIRKERGLSRPDIYVDTTGQPGPGQAFIAYSVEAAMVGVPGADNEVSVNAALWEIVDRPATADATPGSDDDLLDLSNGAAEFWEVSVDYIPSATTISLENFWDGWFSPGIANGHQPEMEAAFAARGIEYFPDASELDGTPAAARIVTPSSPASHHTFYGIGDIDWIVVIPIAGSRG